MPQHFKVHELLSREELDELETFAREPGRTVLECFEWLAARGFVLSHGAVGNWLAHFKEELVKERFSRSGELARAIKDAVKEGAAGEVADATANLLTQVVFEQSVMLQGEQKMDPADLERMTRSLKNLVASKGGLMDLRKSKFETEMKTLASRPAAGTAAISAEDIQRAGKAIFG